VSVTLARGAVVEEWMDGLARALGEQPVTDREMGAVLRLAREVAHGVERKLAPVSTYLAGVHAGRVATGTGPASREDALMEAVEASLALIPQAPADGA
jgi:Domain of unknown function (DUF6457)